MFRKIRKHKSVISIEESKHLLSSERRGVLAVNGDDGYPYSMPINYIYVEDENKIYFHGSRAGHKYDSIKNNDKVCFTVFGNESKNDEDWAPFVQSVIIFGRCKLVSDSEKSLELLYNFTKKYYPNEKLVNEEVSSSGKAAQMFEISIENISGKIIQEK